jgi:hypothetical protein
MGILNGMLDEDTQYGIRRFSARSRNQKHKSKAAIP